MASEYRILGPLEVTLDERFVPVGGRRERAILAVLLLNIGTVVSVERLIDGLWGDARPASAKHMIHEYVSRLRQALVDVAPIVTRPPGYLLERAGGELDASTFSRLSTAARSAASAQRHSAALTAYDQALALWRGDALGDIGLEGHAQIAASRLDHERRLVAEERADCALALGQHLQLIPELEHRLEEAPLRERTRAQLMLALYRAGRQTEALDRYREGRALLVDETGIEPGRELRELERAILTHDRVLELPPVHEVEPPTRGPPASNRSRLAWPLGAVALLVPVAAAIVLIASRSGTADALGEIDANSAGAINPDRNRLVRQVRVGAGPGRIAAGFGSIWVVNAFESTVSRVSTATGSVIQTIPVGGDPTAIAVGAGFVWVASTGTRSVDRIDPRVNRSVQRVPVGNGPSGIAIGPGAVWVSNRFDNTVTEIDSKSGRPLRTHEVGATPSDIAYGLGALWIANGSSATVTRLDPATGGIVEMAAGNGPAAVEIAYESVWVANSLDGTVSRIDPSRSIVTSTITVGSGPSSVLASDGAIWVADSYGGRVVRIDPASNRIVGTIAVGSGPQSLAATGGRIWLSARATASSHRGGTLRLFNIDRPSSLDTGVGYNPSASSIASLTGDGLVGYRRVSGLDGSTLVPDLATSVPRPTDGGRTYTFQLRPGIRYSNGEPVRASDIRRALERLFRLESPGKPLFEGLVGADACSKAHCDLSAGVGADDRTGTVIVRLRTPDPEITYKLALPVAYPVPRRTGLEEQTRRGVAGTGPYMVASYGQARLVLVRNPHFEEWSAAAQPDGYADRIVVRYGTAIDEHLTAVEKGTEDFIGLPLPRSRIHEIETRYAAQVHSFPGTKQFALFLNTRVPPFNSLAARRAFNFAIDRSAAVPGFGGVQGAVVNCQILPAGVPGYRPYCPYTRNPNRVGEWTGPDLARARRLVTASGTRGRKVVVYSGDVPLMLVAGRLAVATLDRLGYRASLKIVGGVGPYFSKVNDSRTRAQTGFIAWAQDYPTASTYLHIFTCKAITPGDPDNVSASQLCDRRVDAGFQLALTRPAGAARAVSGAAWAAVDRLVTDLAPWVPLVTTRDVVVVSRRVGNVQSNPQWGVLFGQMWVR